jgi:hypothetical protein
MENNILFTAYINYLKLEQVNDGKPSQFIGAFDKRNKIWYNGWGIYDPNNFQKYTKSRELLEYGINIDKYIHKSLEEKAIIRSILLNSKFYITEKKTQLDLILSIITYFTKAKRIYKIKNDDLFFYCIN